MEQLYPVIGLEVHAQLTTHSKMFCGCSARYFDSPPNSHVCGVCSGMPGTLPVINGKAVEQAALTALALQCEVLGLSKFDRKNYQYPDIPKGYQISQYDLPIGRNGHLEYPMDDGVRSCGISRVHLEEDTGKSLHTTHDGREVSLLDYNRSGVPLMEIVTKPELHSAEEARAFFEALRRVLMYLQVSDGKLQEGSMRADVNVSLSGVDGQSGTKVEIKNLNSFRAVQRALEYELHRQRTVLLAGSALVQETRGWSEAQEITVSQRTKEYSQDYRYFPEPDLPPLIITEAHIEALAAQLPELPLARTSRLRAAYGLSADLAEVLTAERSLADFFEALVRAAPEVDPSTAAHWVSGDVLRLLNDADREIKDAPVSPEALGRLLAMISGQTVSGTAGKQVLERMFRSGEDPDVIVAREDLRQIVDEHALDELVDTVLREYEELAAEYRRGRTKVIEVLIGRVIQSSHKKANASQVREILERKLGSPG